MSNNYVRRRWASLIQMRLLSVGSFLLCLVLLALLAVLHLVARTAEDGLKEQINISVELYGEMGEDTQQEVLTALRAKPYVLNPRVISADKALDEVADLLGEDPKELLGYNPLAPVLHFSLSSGALSPDSLYLVEKELQEIVPEINLKEREELVSDMQGIFGKIRKGLWVITAIALLFSLIQISSAIQLSLRLEKRKIRTLSLVGASSWFIIRPIVGRATLDGFLSWMLCMLLVAGAGLYMYDAWGINPRDLLSWQGAMLGTLSLMAFAMLLPAILAYRICRKYLRMEEGRLILH